MLDSEGFAEGEKTGAEPVGVGFFGGFSVVGGAGQAGAGVENVSRGDDEAPALGAARVVEVFQAVFEAAPPARELGDFAGELVGFAGVADAVVAAPFEVGGVEVG